MKNKIFGFILIFVGLIISIAVIINLTLADYNYEKDYGSYWELADRSSTLTAKEEYITQYVNELSEHKNDFSDYNAVFLKTPQNSFEYNFKAIVTLRDRLVVIQSMNETSFEYQTAIQQITGQEQGEAQNMISVIEGCYVLENYSMAWLWFMALWLAASIALMILGAFIGWGGYLL